MRPERRRSALFVRRGHGELKGAGTPRTQKKGEENQRKKGEERSTQVPLRDSARERGKGESGLFTFAAFGIESQRSR